MGLRPLRKNHEKILALFALMASASAFAGETATASATTSTSTATSNSASAASNQGNSQTIVFEAEDTGTRSLADLQIANINAEAGRDIATISSDVKVRNTPSVSGQALTTSNDTCMGSASGSVNVPGFGASLGKTYTDDNCIRLKNSRELWNKGMKAASLAMDCKDPDMKEALEMTGYECPQTTRAKQAAAARATPATASVNGYTGNDPIVIARQAGK